MKSNKTKLSLAAASVLATLGVSGAAQADAYAFAWLDISNLTTVFNCSTGGIGCIDIDRYQSDSQTSAEVAGTTDGPKSVVSSSVGGAPTGLDPNAAASQVGIALAEDTYTQAGVSATNDYARGDSIIRQQQLNNAATTAVEAAAEGNLVAEPDAASEGTTGSTTTFQTILTANDTFTVTWTFDANYRQASLVDANGIAGQTTNVFKLTINNLSNVLLNDSYAPTALNNSFSAAANGSLVDTGVQTLNGLTYTTRSFGPGTYSLDYDHEAKVVLTNTSPVPLPGTIALLGIGLVGLGLKKRKLS